MWSAGLSRWEYPSQGGGGTPQTVRVVSAYQVPVAFTVTGQITNPVIVNSRNGSQWSWEGTIPYGRVVTVDVDGVATDWQGNRLLNTMGGLVAAPGDNTFTLTGSDLVVDLQAAWTGTPNASTSTLSQDGAVIATNNTLDPQAKADRLFWPKGTWTAIQGTDGKWTYSISAFDSVNNNDNAVFITPIISDWTPPIVEDYIFVAQFDNLVGVSLAEMNFEANAGTVATGSNWRAVQCKLSANNTVHLAIGIVSNSSSPSAKSFKLVNWGVYSISDWQAMQARGIAWFDGDSTFNIVTAKASVNIS